MQQAAAPGPPVERLGVFVGEWTMRAAVGGQEVGRGRTEFRWIEGGAFLVQHAQAEPTESAPAEWEANSPFPLTTIIGLDDTTEHLCMLYADSRGVFRLYQMSVSDGVWRLWREAPGFFQRFAGTFGDDGNTIAGRWETSDDGTDWVPDFDVTYAKLR